jgi:hypothetical protein
MTSYVYLFSYICGGCFEKYQCFIQKAHGNYSMIMFRGSFNGTVQSGSTSLPPAMPSGT